MKPLSVRSQGPVLLVLVLAAAMAWPQSSATAPITAAVPNITKFSGVLTDLNGKPLTGITGVTFSLYKEEQGGVPLWMETQNVAPDKSGRYTVMLGSTAAHGLPAGLFAYGEARWLGVQPAGQNENPRVLLVSVPYAMKAADAATLGGLPASAFALAESPRGNSTSAATGNAARSSAVVLSPSLSNVTTSGGTANTIPLFTSARNIQNSLLTQTGKTAINVAGKLNLPATGVATAGAGFNSNPLDTQASAFSSGTHTAVTQDFRWQAEPLGNNTTAPSGTLNLLFGAGGSSPSETGLSINNSGIITFASGQTLPNVTGNETVTGDLSASELISTAATGMPPLQVASTTQVPNLNASLLGGLSASSFQPAGSYATLGANSFTGDQTINGNLSLTGSINGGVLLGSDTGRNQMSGVASFVGGGTLNNAFADFSFVGGGSGNAAGGGIYGYGTVVGGQSNTASANYSVVTGGAANTASGENATVPGGFNNLASGFTSFAAGYTAQAIHDGTFVWADFIPNDPFASLGPNMFMARATGGFFFSTTPSSNVAAWLPPGSGSWVSTSDRNVKEHFRAVEGHELLRKLADISMQTWNYKTQAASIRHMGPMAQDFRAAFGLGEDEKHISVVDGEGVALAGVQTLYQLSLEKDKKIAQLSRRINRQAREAQTANRKIGLLTRQCAELAKVSARLAAQQVELDRMVRIHQDAYAEASRFVVKH